MATIAFPAPAPDNMTGVEANLACEMCGKSHQRRGSAPQSPTAPPAFRSRSALTYKSCLPGMLTTCAQATY